MSVKILRKIDEVGRVALPQGMRQLAMIKPGEIVEIMMEDKAIVIKAATPSCCCCDKEDHLIRVKDKYICNSCLSIAYQFIKDNSSKFLESK